MPQILDSATIEIIDRYVSVWNESDAHARRTAVSALWAADGVEFTGSAPHRGHDALDARIAGAYQELVAPRRFNVTRAADASRHDDIVTLTIQLTTPAGEVAWAARVFLVLDAAGLIKEDYQIVVQPFADEAAA